MRIEESNLSHQRQDDQCNVLGGPLLVCSCAPKTGFTRNGYCEKHLLDRGQHIVCAEMTQAFLAFTRSQGNDLMSPRPASGFPGLKPGDRWCLCLSRWLEAKENGVAPPVILAACEASILDFVTIETLRSHALDLEGV